MLFLVTDEKIRGGNADNKQKDADDDLPPREGGACAEGGVGLHHIGTEVHRSNRADRQSDDRKERRPLIPLKKCGKEA